MVITKPSLQDLRNRDYGYKEKIKYNFFIFSLYEVGYNDYRYGYQGSKSKSYIGVLGNFFEINDEPEKHVVFSSKIMEQEKINFSDFDDSVANKITTEEEFDFSDIVPDNSKSNNKNKK